MKYIQYHSATGIGLFRVERSKNTSLVQKKKKNTRRSTLQQYNTIAPLRSTSTKKLTVGKKIRNE